MPRNRFGIARANSLQARPVTQLMIAGTLALGIGALGVHPGLRPAAGYETADAGSAAGTAVPAPAPPIALTEAAPSTPAPAPAPSATTQAATAPRHVMRDVTLDAGETLSDLLEDAGIDQGQAMAAIDALRKVYDPHQMEAGQRMRLLLAQSGGQENLDAVAFEPGDNREITLARNNAGDFTADARLVPMVTQRFAAEGEIHGSLYRAAADAGVPRAIMASLIHIYRHDVDFQHDIHAGDRFQVLYQQSTTARGRAAGEGTILYANLIIDGQAKPAFRATLGDKAPGYFDPKGHSVVRHAVLRMPVADVHITSPYGWRINPISDHREFHPGIDLGEPWGTPIHAAGNGVITQIGWDGGYGRCIHMRINGGIETIYGHMSRFARAMHRGERVTQGEVIGYVGSTGYSTGPHLHFEVHVAGRLVNPLHALHEGLTDGRTLHGRLLAMFRRDAARLKQQFAALLEKSGYHLASASAPAYPTRESHACGLRGGC
ncbi:MAG TPA: M23 family metallopeptidase [Alphaproteobacteria bacterium]|nr:M23 family metallopeptidase [Alphaproteobacteria bacterium]